MTAPASSRTISISRSKPRSLSAPAITAPRAAACWRSTTLAKARRFYRVLDLGTGSGVLAIGAAKIFRTRILATDIDRIAVNAAVSNARLNRAGAVRFIRARHRHQGAGDTSARALRSDLRQYSAGAAVAAGGAAVAAGGAECARRVVRPVAEPRQRRAGDLPRARADAGAAARAGRLGDAGAEARQTLKNKTAPGGETGTVLP